MNESKTPIFDMFFGNIVGCTKCGTVYEKGKPHDCEPIPEIFCCMQAQLGMCMGVGNPVYWNPFNKIVQCHACGHIWEKRKYESENTPKTDGQPADTNAAG